MGIRGLTSYISQNAHRFHLVHHLQDCILVIDGCSLACQLYINVSDCNSAFGGDYDKYAQTVSEFFTLLKQCNVTPLVVIDGGYEARKLKTVSQRLKSKLHNAKSCNPTNQSTATVFPLFLMEVFKQTLRSSDVQFVQADFEADFEIAAIARSLNCPVLSYDSDFYIFDVKYIPFSTLNLTLSKTRCNGVLKHYLLCEVYSVDHFIANFGGLDKTHLPLMATLLGNDYVSLSKFKKFYNHVKLSKSKRKSKQQKRIAAIFEWLRKETYESAVTKILNHLRKKDRFHVKRQIELSVCGYGDSRSELLGYFSVETEKTDTKTIENQEPTFSNDDSSSIDDSSSESDSSEDDTHESDNDISASDEEDDDCDDVYFGRTSAFPVWLREKFRRGDLPSFVSDIFHLHTYFCQPQVEDFTLSDSHTLSFPILNVICGLLFSKEQGEESTQRCHPLICFSRGMGSKHQKVKLQPLLSLPCLPCFPPLTCLPNLPLAIRKEVLYDALGIQAQEGVVLNSFGDKWSLFAMAVVFWARSTTYPNVSNCHLHAIVIGLIALGIVDKKLGRVRSQNKAVKMIAQVSQEKTECNAQFDSCAELGHKPDECLDDILSKVTEVDCLNLVEFLLQFHKMDGKLKGSPRLFSPPTAHIFAQLQTCLLQVMTLNSILEYPVPQCKISETYSGTVAYQAFATLNKRSDVNAFVKGHMANSPSVYHIYKSLLNRFDALLPNIPVLFRKGKRKSKRKNQHRDSRADSDHEEGQDEEPELNYDINNKFSILGVL
ncbi:Protein asteroid [Frankliniella fusca]|uniref:Protein asteroid n=1 Tax=Frankliniella fusca TaxID=407009 RepID=A0AAE1LLG9_9NEOP|nr:Protein asteroid [Frankliniella fusca]